MSNTRDTIPCLICGKTLQNFTADENVNQPSGGTEFIGRGHYGSMFDPMRGGIWLTINICNDCLKEKANQGRVMLTQETYVEPILTFNQWDPNEYFD